MPASMIVSGSLSVAWKMQLVITWSEVLVLINRHLSSIDKTETFAVSYLKPLTVETARENS